MPPQAARLPEDVVEGGRAARGLGAGAGSMHGSIVAGLD
jgi:hypothetical protein